MAITVPTIGSEIDVVTFGKPVVDEINKLSATRLVAGYSQNAVVAKTLANSWIDVPNVVCSFTAVVGRLYRVSWSVNANPSSVGQWVASGLKLDGAIPYKLSAGGAASNVSVYGIDVAGERFYGRTMGGALAAGLHTFQMQMICQGGDGTLGVGSSAPTFIAILDMGADA